MKFLQTNRENLIKTLSNIVGVVERRNTMPILSNVLIKKSSNKLSFITTDIDVQMTTYADFGVPSDDISTTVGARKLLEILKALPEMSQVIIEIFPGKINVLSEKSRFTLQSLDANDFPVMYSDDSWDVFVKMSQIELKSLFNMVYFSMAQQDIRYYLNGMLLVFDNGKISAVATDGHRLSYNSVLTNSFKGYKEVIIPRKTVLEIQRLLQENDDEISVAVSGMQIKFCFRDIEFISKLVEGKFPDFVKVIPQDYTRHFTIDRDLFHGSLQRAAILTNDKFKGIRFQFALNSFKISSSNSEHEEAHEELDIDYKHEPFDVGFNVSYLLDVISNIKSDSLILSVNPDSNSSILITLPGNDSFKYVVMPMRI
ncbi:DNA polymerase III subunit beta [Candidatus Kinetoplastidibacterium crithidiae]|uniref:Beta sliding clamp n=1 Tax=Candidatus Kinetoplastidibacterium crithidiae TCC036E TaxID=1208918 RepID=M1LT89_9PROT|nr:DNA polymerase III subunit beta [Candidatus Kinetoplastibacterium crithidii]AFZ83029.1 DNA polymerase III subunit beta [Candidatus Kinetoplastibacterium crithidii (ex Angomonas deanei ATCC 30255)]AGF47306.1 DNA polymerase III subunit beta [Candidatus Kinetoplastibacterium crithidii TCC036E]